MSAKQSATITLNATLDAFVSMRTTSKLGMVVVGAICIFVLPDVAIHVMTCAACYVLLFGSLRVQPPAKKSVDFNATHATAGTRTAPAVHSKVGAKVACSDSEQSIFCRKLDPVRTATDIEMSAEYREAILKLSRFIGASRKDTTDPGDVQLDVLQSKTQRQMEVAELLKFVHEQQREAHGHQVSRLNSIASQIIPRIEGAQKKIASVMVEMQHPNSTHEHERKDDLNKVQEFVKGARKIETENRGVSDDLAIDTLAAQVQHQTDALQALQRIAKTQIHCTPQLQTLLCGAETKLQALERQLRILTRTPSGLSNIVRDCANSIAIEQTTEKIRQQLFPTLYKEDT